MWLNKKYFYFILRYFKVIDSLKQKQFIEGLRTYGEIKCRTTPQMPRQLCKVFTLCVK